MDFWKLHTGIQHPVPVETTGRYWRRKEKNGKIVQLYAFIELFNAVQIVACWNWNIYTSSWLDIDTVSLSLLYTLDVSHSTGGNPVRSSKLWVKVCAGRKIWFRSLKLTFLNNNHGPGQWVTLHMQVKSEFLQLLLKNKLTDFIASVSKARSGDSFCLQLSSAHRKTSLCLLTEKESIHCMLFFCVCLSLMFLWLNGRALCQQRKRLWVQFPGNTHTDKKCITWMHCMSLWIKASAKCKCKCYAKSGAKSWKGISHECHISSFVLLWYVLYTDINDCVWWMLVQLCSRRRHEYPLTLHRLDIRSFCGFSKHSQS